MNALLVLVATAAMGIEVGWEPLPGGGHEYTIQIEPQLLSVLATGEDEIFSEVPADLDVRRYRILVGSGKLRRDSGPLQPTAADPPVAAAPPAREPTSRLTQPDLGAAAAANSFEQPAPEPADPFEMPSAGQARDDLDDIPPAAADDGLELPTAELPDLPRAGAPADTPAEPRDPWGDYESASQGESAAKGRAETLIVGADAGKSDAGQAPAKLPPDGDTAGQIKRTTYDDSESAETGQTHDAAKPKLDGQAPSEPWFPLIAAIVLLGCSVGGNIYLGWIALDARARYRSAVAKFRGAPA